MMSTPSSIELTGQQQLLRRAQREARAPARRPATSCRKSGPGPAPFGGLLPAARLATPVMLSKRDPATYCQTDNYSVSIMIPYPGSSDAARPMELSELRVFLQGRGRTELLAGGDEAPPDPAGGQPGRPPARGERRRAAVRPRHQGRHPDRGRPAAARLRRAPAAPVRGGRSGGQGPARPAPRPRADRRQRSLGPRRAADDRALPRRRTRWCTWTSGACRRGRSAPRSRRARSTSAC